MKKTIIELEKEIAILERDKETISAKDELMRKEISEALGFFKLRQVYYNDTREINVLSWFQIMKELGLLLARDNFGKLYQEIKEKVDYLLEKDNASKPARKEDISNQLLNLNPVNNDHQK